MVTLEEAKDYLRYDGTDSDAELRAMIAAAENVITKHCDTGSDFTLPVFRQAALLLLGYWDDNRNAQSGENWYLPPHVVALLTPYRTPVAV